MSSRVPAMGLLLVKSGSIAWFCLVVSVILIPLHSSCIETCDNIHLLLESFLSSDF